MKETQHVKDLTQGNIGRELISLAIPMVLCSVLQEFYNTIDAFIVGRYADEAQFAAIGVAGTVMNLFLYILIGACSGFSILFARAYGFKDMKELRKEFAAGIIVGLVFTLALAGFGAVGNPWILRLLQTPEELIPYVLLYLKWIVLALPVVFLYNVFAAVLRASGDIRPALYVLAGSIVSNLVMDYWLVGRCSMGIEGAGIATAVTQLLSAIGCYLYLYFIHAELRFTRQDLQITGRHLRRMMKFGFVSACQQCSLYLGKMLVQGSVNTLGTESIAAYTAGGRIESFPNSFSASGSTSTSILVSQNMGSGDAKRVEETYRWSTRVLFSASVLSVAAMVLLTPTASRFLLGSSATKSYTEALRYLYWISPWYLCCFRGSTFTGFFSGYGRLDITTAGTVLHIAIRVVLSMLLVPHIGLVAVALATGIGWLVAIIWWNVIKIRLTRQKNNYE